MVNNVNISRYSCRPPDSANDSREISGGPLYQPADILAILGENGCNSLIPWTRKCINDMQKYALDSDDADEFIRIGMRNGHFLGSEWCEQKPNGPWAACDAYRVFRREWIKAADKEMDVEYYIKFAIGKTGLILLLVSCHLSENR